MLNPSKKVVEFKIAVFDKKFQNYQALSSK